MSLRFTFNIHLNKKRKDRNQSPATVRNFVPQDTNQDQTQNPEDLSSQHDNHLSPDSSKNELVQELSYLLQMNQDLENRVRTYRNKIESLENSIKQNEEKIGRICPHEWQRDFSDIERVSYYCVRCLLNRGNR